jgi:hypothetical protein
MHLTWSHQAEPPAREAAQGGTRSPVVHDSIFIINRL